MRTSELNNQPALDAARLPCLQFKHHRRGTSEAEGLAVKRTLLLIACAACLLVRGEAGTIPPELVGVWAPTSAKLDRGVLSEGYAIYINTNGLAAVVIAPPPIGAKWFATYGATNHLLTLRIDARPSEGLSQAMTNHFTYDPKAKTLMTTEASTTYVLRHHSNRIPGFLIEDLR